MLSRALNGPASVATTASAFCAASRSTIILVPIPKAARDEVSPISPLGSFEEGDIFLEEESTSTPTSAHLADLRRSATASKRANSDELFHMEGEQIRPRSRISHDEPEHAGHCPSPGLVRPSFARNFEETHMVATRCLSAEEIEEIVPEIGSPVSRQQFGSLGRSIPSAPVQCRSLRNPAQHDESDEEVS
eukprot:gene27633-7271_t